MNPMVRAYLERLNTSLDDVQEAVQEIGGGLSHEKERSERLLKQYWNRGKELSVLQQTAGRWRRSWPKTPASGKPTPNSKPASRMSSP